ncbi:hypothetical protein PANG_00018 [Paenibacillus phage PG1]|uniref:tail fiber protein n=1 Tax=Paenibacillus phage PG1 TaxID=754053 RepID=UPI0003425D48|nr:tail fiber protein [Paenibacillus phage PG1]AGN33739.1 hypothetical protein PANG_00018 [Paenibacillus phage PG1]
MASRYGGITGSKKISEDFQNINTAFENVQAEMDSNKTVVDNHIASSTAHKAEDITYQGDATGNNVKQAIDGMDSRIDNLIITGGDSSPEVADARGSYPVLGDRLNAFDADLSFNIDSINSRGINVKYPPAPLVGAKFDGITDDTTAIQNIINASPVNSLIFLPVGTCLISNLNVNKPVTIMGSGKTQTKLKVQSGSGIIFASGNNSYAVQGLGIEAVGAPKTDGTYGISGIGTDLSPNGIGYTKIEDVQITGFDHGIHLEYNQLAHISRTQCEANNVGIYTKRCVNMQYEAVIASLNLEYGFYIDGDAGFISFSCGSLLQGCTLVNNGANGGANFYIVYNEYFSIVNCMIDVPATGSTSNITTFNCTRGNIIGNWIGASYGIGINVLASNELTIIGNEIVACATMGMVLDSSGHNIIKGNSFTNNGDADVVLVGTSSRNLISGNMLMSTTSTNSIIDNRYSIITDNFCRKSILAHETSKVANNFENY